MRIGAAKGALVRNCAHGEVIHQMDFQQTVEFGFGDAEQPKPKSDLPPRASQSSTANSCDDDIRIMEDEIREMRASCLTPGQETLVIKKEVEVLKKYCSKLCFIQEENARLKKCNEELQLRCIESEQKLEVLGKQFVTHPSSNWILL